MADCTQFLWENRLDGCQIFGWFGFKKTESKPNFFPHMSLGKLFKHSCRVIKQYNLVLATWW